MNVAPRGTWYHLEKASTSCTFANLSGLLEPTAKSSEAPRLSLARPKADLVQPDAALARYCNRLEVQFTLDPSIVFHLDGTFYSRRLWQVMVNSKGPNETAIELSVVIPAYKSSRSVAELVERLTATLGQLDREYEIIFVEDDSPDDTWNELCRVRERFGSRIVLIRLASNRGQHNALMCGFRHVRGRIILTIDDDLQCKPEVLVPLLKKFERDKLDLVYGNYPTQGQSLMRIIASVPMGLFAILVFGLSSPPTSVRVISRQLLESILYYRGPFTVVDGLLCWNTRRIGGMQIERGPRPQGRSTYTIAKLVGLAFNVFTSFSVAPLRIISLMGAAISIAGIASGIGAAAGFKFGDNPSWLLPLIAVILLLSGIQLFSLGLMCEYLGRIFISLNGKPQYIVRESVGVNQQHSSSRVEIATGALRQ